jgi:aminomethyltransferase
VLPETKEASAEMKPFNVVIVPGTAFGEVMVARTGYTGEDGFEIGVAAERAADLWNALAAAGVKPAGLGARDTLRLEAGMNLYGQDMDETVNPLDAGLAWTIDLVSERDFTGKQALLEQGQKAQFLGLILREKGGILRAHQKVMTHKERNHQWYFQPDATSDCAGAFAYGCCDWRHCARCYPRQTTGGNGCEIAIRS